VRLELLGNAGEATQVGEQHHRVGAHVGRGQHRVEQLRVLEDLVGDPGRHVAAERLAQHFLASPEFSFQLNRRRFPAHHPGAHEGLAMGPERLIRQHTLPKEIILLRQRISYLH
jgi:hypothetical protein